MLARAIPKTNELIPVIGMGTYKTFDEATPTPALIETVRRFIAAGGRVIDSSPMYGRSESITGELLAELDANETMFLATKVWTTGQANGEKQMATSLQRMRRKTIDLMQIHNLVDWRVHLRTLRAWKDSGRARYIGVTHYQLSAFTEIERIIENEDIDFVQIPYSAGVRDAEKRILPAAKAHGVAVLVMEPFETGGLLGRTAQKPLPAVARELDCHSWAELFLKFILAHPAVTAPIPATANPEHVAANLRAGLGSLPTDAQKAAIAAAI